MIRLYNMKCQYVFKKYGCGTLEIDLLLLHRWSRLSFEPLFLTLTLNLKEYRVVPSLLNAHDFKY